MEGVTLEEGLAITDDAAFVGDDVAAAAVAFTELVHSRLDESYRLARVILRSQTDAEDAVHDAFLSAWRRRRSLRDPAHLDAWFGRIVVNACRDRLRHRRRHPVDPLAGQEHGALAPAGSVDDRLTIGSAMQGLEANQVIVLVLRYYRDLSVPQIATLLGLPQGTVKSRLHHSLKALGMALEAQPARSARRRDDR